MLLGRRTERREVDQLLAAAQAGQSGALVVRGEAGIGKTALLGHGRDTAEASGFRVETSTGSEAETQFAFAGLHQLCAPLLDGVDMLPEPQQTALGVALGTMSGPTPDRFLVGLATLNLLAEITERAPLLCLIDDAHWLDRASAEVLAFVARRVRAERLALVFALRTGIHDGSHTFAGLPELHVHGLDEQHARQLLDGAVHEAFDDEVRDRIIAEARGNPLALLELPASAPPAQLAGGYQVPDLRDVPTRVEDGFQRRWSNLTEPMQQLLLVAAAEPSGDVDLLWRAAAQLDISPDPVGLAGAAGLVELDTRVRFRHPLVRSAVYRAAAPPDRRRAHGALAVATDPIAAPDRRAWHKAQSTAGVDEDVAAALEDSAGRARARGGYAAAAAFLQRSADLTPDASDRARRALEAADANHGAGASEAARDLLAVAETGPLSAVQSARLELLRARIAFHLTRGAEVPQLLMRAAHRFASLDPALSRETYLHALDAAAINGGDIGRRIADAVLADSAPADPARGVDLLLHGLATAMASDVTPAVPALRLALQTLREDTVDAERNQPWLWLAGRVAVGILDDDLAHALADVHVRLSRAAGALALAGLQSALNFKANLLVISGQLTRAAELAAEAREITESTGGVPLRHAEAIVAAWSGDRAVVAQCNELTFQDASNPEDGAEAALAHYASAVLHNGIGKYSSAQKEATKACGSVDVSLSTVGLPELIESSARAGEPDRAKLALDQLSARARASGTEWALGLEARSRALTMAGPAAEEQYREAIARLDASRMAGEAARAHLVYGEWLRRQGRRLEARETLREAHARLSTMGAEAFAARAARELRATGEHPRKRTAQPTDDLTAHELHIARLVATGATSREVGAQLYLSPRTIEAHLRNIFRKLDITSRRQLEQLSLP